MYAHTHTYRQTHTHNVIFNFRPWSLDCTATRASILASRSGWGLSDSGSWLYWECKKDFLIARLRRICQVDYDLILILVAGISTAGRCRRTTPCRHTHTHTHTHTVTHTHTQTVTHTHTVWHTHTHTHTLIHSLTHSLMIHLTPCGWRMHRCLRHEGSSTHGQQVPLLASQGSIS